ncbi:MAG: anion permease [Clostridia bacterium]|nr:anion permease [Clostridia bacterium]
MIYLLLAAGIFMGWSLGTNDAANAFGTAVSTGVVKYRTATIIISILVVIGAFLMGSGNMESVNDLAINNAVIPSGEQAAELIKNGASNLALKSAIKAFIIFACAGATVFLMSYLKFPVSANQSITGAIIGWGIFHADYGNPEVLSGNLKQIGKFASTWLLCPLGAAIISFIIVKLAQKFLFNKLTSLSHYDSMIKIGYLIAGAHASFSIGMNSSANVTSLYYGEVVEGVKTNLLTDARLTCTLGGLAIALGVLTYSKKVMMTVGESIAPLTQIEGFLVIIAMATTIVLLGNFMKIPVSTSQAVVGAVVGAGLTKSVKCVNFGVFKNIAIAWVSSPLMAGVLTYLVALATQKWL